MILCGVGVSHRVSSRGATLKFKLDSTSGFHTFTAWYGHTQDFTLKKLVKVPEFHELRQAFSYVHHYSPINVTVIPLTFESEACPNEALVCKRTLLGLVKFRSKH